MSKLKTKKAKILMTHLYYGDISPKFSENLATTLVDAGADILEIGIPYSDPVSDGPVFQKACRDALMNGITPIDVLEGVKRIRDKTDIPIYLTSYFAPIFKTGVERILTMAKEAKISGFIIPDLPIEEQGDYEDLFKKNNLSVIQFATVYSNRERLKTVVNNSDDFIYCVSLPGVTGDRVDEAKIENLIKNLKKMTDKKVFCGFGIKTDTDAGKIIKYGADGVIVGSAIAEIYQKELYPSDLTVRLSSSIRTRLTERSKEDLRISNAQEIRKEILKKIGSLIKNIKNAID